MLIEAKRRVDKRAGTKVGKRAEKRVRAEKSYIAKLQRGGRLLRAEFKGKREQSTQSKVNPSLLILTIKLSNKSLFFNGETSVVRPSFVLLFDKKIASN